MLRVVAIAMLLAAVPAGAIESRWDEGDLIGYPLLFDGDGDPIGHGDFSQTRSGSTLEVRSVFRFDDGRIATEHATFVTEPELRQTSWRFEEHRGDALLRRYEVDLESGKATAEKHEGTRVRRHSNKLKIPRGDTFAGVGFVFAAKNLMEKLETGASEELTAVAFTPKPRAVRVRLKSAGKETISAGTTAVPAERITIHPEIPRIARLFVHPTDSNLWFARRSPPQFLRSEATLAEPEEPVLQINLFGGSTKIRPREEAPQ